MDANSALHAGSAPMHMTRRRILHETVLHAIYALYELLICFLYRLTVVNDADSLCMVTMVNCMLKESNNRGMSSALCYIVIVCPMKCMTLDRYKITCLSSVYLSVRNTYRPR